MMIEHYLEYLRDDMADKTTEGLYYPPLFEYENKVYDVAISFEVNEKETEICQDEGEIQ